MAQIHIVLATYNGENFIREQMDSLLANTFRDITVEVCDDGSTDGTVEIVSEYVKRDSRVTLHRNEKNLGYVMNFLEGIRRSESPYIMLCDQDDIWHADKIEKTYERMKQLEGENSSGIPLLVFSDAMNFDSESGRELGSFHKNSHLNVKKIDSAHLFMENKCIGCTVMVNGVIRDYLNVVPDAIRVHDWWLALICSHFGKISYIEETTLQYRQHSGNMIGGSDFSSYIGNRMGHVQKQRKALRDTFAQGKAFYEVFADRMGEMDKERALHFSEMLSAGWFRRRAWLFSYGYWKSGFIRNAALLLLI